MRYQHPGITHSWATQLKYFGESMLVKITQQKLRMIQRSFGSDISEECQKPQAPLLSKKVSQYTSTLYSPPICMAVLLAPLHAKEREMPSVLLPFVSQCSSHLYRSTPPIFIAVRLPFFPFVSQCFSVVVTGMFPNILFPYRTPSPRPCPDPTQHPKTRQKPATNRLKSAKSGNARRRGLPFHD